MTSIVMLLLELWKKKTRIMFIKLIERNSILEQHQNTCMTLQEGIITLEGEAHIKQITLILMISNISIIHFRNITTHFAGSKIMLQIQLTEPILQSK